MKRILSCYCFLVVLLTMEGAAHAQVSYTGGVYKQDFNTLAGTTNNQTGQVWTNNTTLPGWYSSLGTYNVTDGTLGGSAAAYNPTTGNNIGLFSFGSPGSSDRALGSRTAGSIPSIYYGVRLVNNTGLTLTRFTVTYTGEQWFQSVPPTAHTLLLDYQFGASAISSGAWTAIPSATFAAPVNTETTPTALNGNNAANRTVKVAVVTGVSWAPGQELWVRIRDDNELNEEQGLGADDFCFLADNETGLFFDGSASYVRMGAPTAALGASSFTIECRFLRTGQGATTSTGTGGVTGVPLVTKGRGENDASNVDCNYFVGIDANNKLCADFEQLNATNNGTAYAAGQNFPVVGSTTLQNGIWYHVAATYDAASAVWKLYVNGVAETTSVVSGSPATFPGVLPRNDSIQHFGIGTALNSTDVAAGFFNGVIDEVRVWNIARSQSEISASKDLEITSGLPNLLARYGLDEGTGTAAGGISGVGSAPGGTLLGTTLPQWVNSMAFAANTPPSVSLTSPTASYSGVAPATVSFAATASDPGGSVARVDFYQGSTKVGEDTSAPYTFVWTNVPAGSYSLTAIATDNGGASTTSSPVSITVSPNPNRAPAVTPASPANGAADLGTSTTLNVNLSDPEGDAMTVTFYGRQTAPTAPGADFSLIAIPDTQFYSENTGRNPSSGGTGAVASIFNAQTQWIVDNRASRNIAFVSHMGDFVQNGDNGGNPAEWIIADGAMKAIENQIATLRAFGLPWGGAPGNHDQSPSGDAGGTTAFFNQYFHFNRWAGRNYYGGHYGTNNNNNYELFSASGLDFIVLHLEYDVRSLASYQAVLDWANAVLQAYPNRRAIVTSHWTLNTGNPASFSTQGQNIYNALKGNPNLFLMLGGHVAGEGQRSDTFNGRTVHAVLQDYQDAANGGNGFLRIFTFSPANNRITVESYSPTLGRAVQAVDNVPSWTAAYALPYNMQTALTNWVPLGAVNVPAGGSAASVNWTGLAAGKDYEWYAAASDGTNAVDGAARRFSTAAPVPPTVSLTAPANGSSYPTGAAVALEAAAADADGTVARVEFYEGNTKLGEDTSAPYQFTWNNVASGPHNVVAVAVDDQGNGALSNVAAVSVAYVSTPLISKGAVWKYLDNGSDQGAAWREAAYDDGNWTSGTAELGYGDGDEATVVSYGPDSANRYITTYFRRTIAVPNPSLIAGLTLNLRRDDGAVIYVNGVEAGRSNMPAGTVTYTTLASLALSGTDETEYVPFSVSPSLLVPGLNVIAVEIHQSSASSTDLSFDLELNADTSPSGNAAPSVALTAPTVGGTFAAPGPINFAATASDADGTVAKVAFYNGSQKVGEDTAAPYAFSWPNVGPGAYTLRAVAIDNAGTATISAPVSVTVNATSASSSTLFARNSVWKYLDKGANQGSAWSAPGFNDSAWAAGPAKLGYEDSPATTVSYGPDANNRYITTYFRSEFTVSNPAAISALTLNLLRDDGAVIYLNGAEVARSNMPLGAIAYNTLASTSVGNADETTFFPVTLNPSSLVPGRNVLAVEVHQQAVTSSDLGFDMDLVAGGTQAGSGSLTRGPYLQKAGTNRVTIRWRSSGSIAGRVRYGTAVNSLTQSVDEPSARTEHEIELTGLSPGTAYYYSIGSAADTLAGGDADYSFKTAPVTGSPVNARFWVLGDCGRANADQQAVRDAFYNYTGARAPDATLLLGDNAYDNGTDTEYQAAVFNMYSAMIRKSPLWSCLGNHETAQATAFVDSYPYFQLFTFPTAGECGGVPSGTEHYYSFDYGNVHFISLDSMTASRSSSGAMANWLRSDLASTTARWVIAMFHHPPYSKGSHDSDVDVELTEMRQNILPILEAGGVDLVLGGHSHAYERSYLLDGHYGLSGTLTAAMKKNGGSGNESTAGAYVKPMTGPRDHFGAVYAVTGSAGQISGGALNHPAMYVSLNNLGSMVLDINDNRLNATFLRETGARPDSFSLFKAGEADSDGDGIPDEWEIAHSLDRHNPADAGADADGDGFSNFEEWMYGLSPDVRDRYVWTVASDPQTHNMTITFATLPGRKYQVQWSQDMVDWRSASAVYPGDGNPRTVVDDGAVTGSPSSSQPNRFYRVRVTTP